MTITIPNGQGIIDILSDGFVTSLKIRKPVAADWYDNAGSAGKFFAFTPQYEPIVQAFNDVLVNGDDAQILDSMTGFLQLFSPGQYSIYIDRNNRTDYALHFDYSQSEDQPGFSYWYYNPGGDNLMFTQPYARINPGKIKEYENMIANDLRPKAIVFEAHFNDYETYVDGSHVMSSVDSPMYILDGHHKLLAYKNLDMQPEFVLIRKERIGKDEFAKSEDTLYFEYEYFLSDTFKQHIISYTPKLLTDDSIPTETYNLHFDNYLKSTRHISREILILFKEAGNSNEQPKMEWLQERLTVIKERDLESSPMWLNFFEINPQHPHGIWGGMNIKSLSDLTEWVIKLFGKSI
jgi:hypothetical protein